MASSSKPSENGGSVTYKGLLYMSIAMVTLISGILTIHSQVVSPAIVRAAVEETRDIIEKEIKEHLDQGVHKGAITETSIHIFLDPLKEDIRELKAK